MIPNVMVGPPLQGFSGASKPREAEKSLPGDASGSFAKVVGDRWDPNAKAPPKTKDREDSDRSEVGRKENEDGPPKPLLPQSTARPGPKNAAKNGTVAREGAIRKFMDSFESEFGTPPEKIVEAMALLEPKDLNQPPEETAQAVVSHLDLDEQDQEKAQAMYAGLLVNLRSIDQANTPPKFIADQATMTAPVVQERVLLSQERKSAVNKGVDRLNEKFWLKDQPNHMEYGKPVANPAAENLQSMNASEMGLNEGEEMAAGAELIPAGAERPLAAQAQHAPVGDMGPLPDMKDRVQSPMTPQSMQRMLAEMKRAADQAKAAPNGDGEASVETEDSAMPAVAGARASNEGRANAKNDGPNEALIGTAVAGPQAQRSMPQDAGRNSEFQGRSSSQQEHSRERSSSKDSSSSSSSGDFIGPTATPLQPLKMEDVAAALRNPAVVGGGVGAAALAKMDSGDHEANVQQIMNQAQYLIKKGGGEVKVQMTPEGLGQIEMKVMVKDGKVNVQMATDTPEAKKAIESSMSDLRTSLAAHKLSVDHIKVDVVSGTNTENQARGDNTTNQNPQRDHARQFWNQFQDNFGNRGAREGMWDGPAMKGYRQNKTPGELQPLEAQSVSSTARTMSEGKGQGLNLVA